ncbi:hypothetical protein L915_10601 [Phytophthora nicotianae]|nr:hypothetical protein L915_10601 [Phytophthora nicotianae]ETM44296.1 hypothetical protein L914_10452 [Phytophthora nicotianae]
MQEREEDQYNKQVARALKPSKFWPKERGQIRLELERTADVSCSYLLGCWRLARFPPNKEKLEHRWKTADEGPTVLFRAVHGAGSVHAHIVQPALQLQ